MQLHRNEITTGIFVLLTVTAFVVILVLIGIPGVFSGVKTFRIYFDNASGIRSGAPVLLAGREIGKVSAIFSPISFDERPKGHPDYEVAVEVKVDQHAQIYKKTKVQLKQQTLMGVRVIDFLQGDEKSELAADHTEFVGERIADVGESISGSLKQLLDPNSDLSLTLKNTREFSDTLKHEPWRLVWPASKEYPEDKSKKKK
jgi:phospholipid/cholesterol/gamma-HCH transport system substrate-binding protein